MEPAGGENGQKGTLQEQGDPGQVYRSADALGMYGMYTQTVHSRSRETSDPVSFSTFTPIDQSILFYDSPLTLSPMSHHLFPSINPFRIDTCHCCTAAASLSTRAFPLQLSTLLSPSTILFSILFPCNFLFFSLTYIYLHNSSLYPLYAIVTLYFMEEHSVA